MMTTGTKATRKQQYHLGLMARNLVKQCSSWGVVANLIGLDRLELTSLRGDLSRLHRMFRVVRDLGTRWLMRLVLILSGEMHALETLMAPHTFKSLGLP